MAKLTMKEVVQTAIKAEELGAAFYKELADKLSQNQELRSVFERLAKDEAAHKKHFAELLDKVSEKEYRIDEDKEVFLKACDVSKFFPKMEKIDAAVKPEDVLKNAYQFEKESALYYIAIQDVIGGNELEPIIEAEKRHTTQIMKYILTESKFRGIEDSWT